MDTWGGREKRATALRWRAGLLPENDIRAWMFDDWRDGKQVNRESENQDAMHATRRCVKNTSVDR